MPKSNDERESWRDRGVRPDATKPLARASGDGVVDIDVSWLVPADLGAVDALARLHVLAFRCGRSLLMHGAGGGLAELLEFVGLSDVVHLCLCSRGACRAADHPDVRVRRRAEPRS